MITDYTILCASRQDYLIETVMEHVADGWIPQGSVCLAHERNIQRSVADKRFLAQDFQHYCQAMIKHGAGD